MDIQHLSFSIFHMPGIKNMTADFRSCRPRDSYEAYSEEEVPTKLSLGVRTVRAEREMIADERLARIGDADPSYKMLIHYVENRRGIEHLAMGCRWRYTVIRGQFTVLDLLTG